MAIEVETTRATLVMLLVIGLSGAAGGTISELMLTRTEGSALSTGRWERRRRLESFFDLGSWAAILVGVGAAYVAFALVSPPEQAIKGEETVSQYEPWRIIALGIIAGLAGPQFLAQIRDRFMTSIEKSRDRALLEGIYAGVGKAKKDASEKSKQARKRAKEQGRRQAKPEMKAAARGMTRSLRSDLAEAKLLDPVGRAIAPSGKQGARKEPIPVPPEVDEEDKAEAVGMIIDASVDSVAESLEAGITAQLSQIEALCETALAAEPTGGVPA